MKNSLLVLFYGLVFQLPLLNGQDNIPADTAYLEEVSISVLPFREKYLEAAGAVYSSRKEEISREFGMVSSSLYNRAPGVFMSSGALNTHRLTIRGVGSRTPYSSNRIRAYLDDIPLTSGDGISTVEDQDLLAIGSMEVLKGPSSAVYGSGLGGVIRLNSPYPDQPGLKTHLLAEAGSFGSQRYALTGAYKNGATALTGGISRTGTNGFRENSKYLRNNAFLHARVFGLKHQLSLTFSLIDLRSGIPSSLNEDDFLNNPDKAGGSWGSIGGFEEYIKLLAGLKLESRIGERMSNRLILFGGYGDPYERRPFNILDEQSTSFGIAEMLEYSPGQVKLGVGAEYFHEFFDWGTYQTLPENQGPVLSDQSETRKYLNTFVWMQWRPGPGFIVDVGLNLNTLSYGLTTKYRVDSTDQSGTYSYSPVLSPRIGVSYKHRSNIWSYVSAGHGFSAPSLEETLLPGGMVNTSLRPESGWNMDLGNRGILAGGHLEYDLSIYSVLLQDLLVTERLAQDVFTGVNAGSAWNRGLELMARGRLRQPVEPGQFNAGIQLSYHLIKSTFTDFVDEGIDYSGKNLPGIPRQLLRTELTAELRGFLLSARYNYTGQQWMNDANNKQYDPCQLVNLRIDWKGNLGSAPLKLDVYGGVRNLFNTRHASMILINAPSFGGNPPRYYYPGTPRYLYLGVGITFLADRSTNP